MFLDYFWEKKVVLPSLSNWYHFCTSLVWRSHWGQTQNLQNSKQTLFQPTHPGVINWLLNADPIRVHHLILQMSHSSPASDSITVCYGVFKSFWMQMTMTTMAWSPYLNFMFFRKQTTAIDRTLEDNTWELWTTLMFWNLK